MGKSAYMLRLESQMRPLVDQLTELNDLDELSDAQRSDFDAITAQLTGMKSDYEKAVDRATKATGWTTNLDTLLTDADPPRANGQRAASTAMERKQRDAEPEVKSLADYLIDSKAFKNPRNGQYDVVEHLPTGVLYPFLERKAAYIPGNLNLSGPNLRVIEPAGLNLRFPLLDLLPTVPWNEMVVPYLPLTFTNNAQETDYGQAKTESTNTGDIATIMMKTIAHWKEVPRQILRYIPALRTTIENELRQGVLAALQRQVLNGTGLTKYMKGILAQVTNTASGADLVSQIFDAIGQIENAGGTVDAILMNPGDYAALIQSEWSENVYNPLIQGERFGQYRIIRLSVQAAGTATVGDFSSSTTLFMGEAANVQATEALGFKNNIVTLRGEVDAVVLVERPWLLYKCPGPLVAVGP